MYKYPGNLNGGFTWIFKMRIRQSGISFSDKPDLVDSTIPGPLLRPLLWPLCHCVSVTNKLNEISCSPGHNSTSPICVTSASHSSCTWWHNHLLKQAFSTSKLTSSWGFARWKLARETMKRVKLEGAILEKRASRPWKFILGTNLHKLL